VERPVGIPFEISRRNHDSIAPRGYATAWCTFNHKLASAETEKKPKNVLRRESDEAFKQVYLSQIMR